MNFMFLIISDNLPLSSTTMKRCCQQVPFLDPEKVTKNCKNNCELLTQCIFLVSWTTFSKRLEDIMGH